MPHADDNQMIPGSATPEAAAILHNVLTLGRLLRMVGLPVGPGRVIDLTRALQQIPLSRRDDVYFTVRSLLVSRREDFDKFDRVFDLFWNSLVALGLQLVGCELLEVLLAQHLAIGVHQEGVDLRAVLVLAAVEADGGPAALADTLARTVRAAILGRLVRPLHGGVGQIFQRRAGW